MCGRYVAATTPGELADYLGVDEIRTEGSAESYNVAPTDEVYVVAQRSEGRVLGTMKWGLVPHWAKDPSIGSKMINVRAETISDKFGRAFERRRCLVPADGFYEWEKRDDGTRHPFYIRRHDGAPLAFAGLWERWGDDLRTCTIVTTEANDMVGRIHDRMPVVLAPSDWDTWLDRDNKDTDSLAKLLVPADERAFEMYEVNRAVNSVKNNAPELIEPSRPS